MYNIGGFGSSHSVVWCRLGSSASPLWKSMDLANYGFKQYSFREALVVANKIVYFGSEEENAAFVLEREGESEQLKVVRKG